MSGYLEVVLDRRNQRDDGRGLGQGLDDNVPTPARLRLLVESGPGAKVEHYVVEYPSLLSYWVQQSLMHPVFVGHKPEDSSPTRFLQLMWGYVYNYNPKKWLGSFERSCVILA